MAFDKLNNSKEKVFPEGTSMVCMTDTRNIVTWVDDTFARFHGFTPEEMIGRPAGVIRHPEVPAAFFEDMKATSSAPSTSAPQRRNRGTRIIAAPTVSTIPMNSAAARLNGSGTLACAMRTAQPCTSVIFQSPEERNSAHKSNDEIQLSMLCQPGASVRRSPGPGCAILSFMDLIVPLRPVCPVP